MNKTEMNIFRQLLAKFRQNVDNKSNSIVLPGISHEDALAAVDDVESIVKETMRTKHNWKYRDDVEG